MNIFPLFLPNSAGTYESNSALAIQTINQTIPFLNSLIESVSGIPTQIKDINQFARNNDAVSASEELKVILDSYGSDKALWHNYHLLYGEILKNKDSIKYVLEVGLGTNNTDVVSNMGENGKPGASLRAFRDFLPNAKIFGADIDVRILFKEDRIETFFVDQTKPETFELLRKNTPDEFDLIIDDGLHSVDANIQTLKFALAKVRAGGWVVIEDISNFALPIWNVVATVLPVRFESHLIEAIGGNLFAVQKLY